MAVKRSFGDDHSESERSLQKEIGRRPAAPVFPAAGGRDPA
jgi:hypothetical protein